jgi:hypothetical protein
MQANFQALDAVFATDNPICAVNLKKMWCEYACNAEKINFESYTGSTPVNTTEGIVEYANVNFNIDSDYACQIFQSCKQVGFIA